MSYSNITLEFYLSKNSLKANCYSQQEHIQNKSTSSSPQGQEDTHKKKHKRRSPRRLLFMYFNLAYYSYDMYLDWNCPIASLSKGNPLEVCRLDYTDVL